MPACPHARTRLVAKDKDAEYLECLDCGAVLEADELPKHSSPKDALPKKDLPAKSGASESEKEKQGPEGPSETLSDA